MGVAVNLATYLTGTMHLGSANSANTVTNFMGTSLMLCLFGGFVADTFIGRYLTIAIFATVQALYKICFHGVTILTISTIIPSLHPPKCIRDATRCCMSANNMQLMVLYIALYTTSLGIGGLKSSVSGFGTDQFDDSDKGEKKQMLKFFNWFVFFISLGTLTAVTVLVYIQDHIGSFLDKAAIKDPKMDGEEITMQRNWYLSTLTDVEEVKMVQRILPVWATTIMFWTVYAQMTTFSVQQATTMDRRIGNSFQIPAASLTVFFVGSVLLTVPIYDRVITPIAKKISHNPQGLTPLQRIGVGLVFSIFAMVSAALIEIKRLRMAQFFFVGSGEAFTYIGQLDFFLRECPRGMKTMSTGLFLSTLSLGFFLSSLLVTVARG
ncbi:Putative peptide/nitrate transporter [Glycine soja]|uniref:Putative peptide/nitrate transporter n=1 Tax=Glycine soja TaxID=3848 RepID=A0A0B2P9Q7_GLYSO|nr:Putative peptide/nitrate transporter [Glycine soja]